MRCQISKTESKSLQLKETHGVPEGGVTRAGFLGTAVRPLMHWGPRGRLDTCPRPRAPACTSVSPLARGRAVSHTSVHAPEVTVRATQHLLQSARLSICTLSEPIPAPRLRGAERELGSFSTKDTIVSFCCSS